MWVSRKETLKEFETAIKNGSPGRPRTSDLVVNSHPLYPLSYRGALLLLHNIGLYNPDVNPLFSFNTWWTPWCFLIYSSNFSTGILLVVEVFDSISTVLGLFALSPLLVLFFLPFYFLLLNFHVGIFKRSIESS